MSARILVTGGAGFIGSHLVDALIRSGYAITVLDDLSTGSTKNLDAAEKAGDLRFVHGTILSEADIRKAMDGCGRVFHLAVQCVRRSLGDPLESHAVNATGTINVLEAARRARVDRFLYCSSSEVYGNSSSKLLNEDTTICRPVTAYGAAKLAGELYTEAYRQTYNLPTQVVRPFNAYGPRAHLRGDLAEVIPRFVIRVLNGRRPVVFGSGSNGRDFTYVTDVARGLILAGQSEAAEGMRVNIAHGNFVSIAKVAQLVMQICGRNDLSMEIAAPRPGDVHVLQAETKKAQTLLGYRAEISFEDGLRRYVDWFRQSYPDPSEFLEATVENWIMPKRDNDRVV